jgi:single-stranded DNA-binding protein
MDITKFTVMENTERYRKGEWVADDAATPHHIEAKFELGAAAAQLRKGEEVIVVGYERTNSWQKDGEERQYKRVIEADQIGASLTTRRPDAAGTEDVPQGSAERPVEAPSWNVTPIGQNASAADAVSGFTGFSGEISAELVNARTQLASAQALNDYEQITYWTRAIVDLDRADEGRA